jgi:hypothetical protein
MKLLQAIIAILATLALWALLLAAGFLWTYWITAVGFIAWGFIYFASNPPWKPKGRWGK